RWDQPKGVSNESVPRLSIGQHITRAYLVPTPDRIARTDKIVLNVQGAVVVGELLLRVNIAHRHLEVIAGTPTRGLTRMVDEAGEMPGQHEVGSGVHKAIFGDDIAVAGRHAFDLFDAEGLIEIVPHPRNGAAWDETRGDDPIAYLLIDEPKLCVRMQHRWLFS